MKYLKMVLSQSIAVEGPEKMYLFYEVTFSLSIHIN